MFRYLKIFAVLALMGAFAPSVALAQDGLSENAAAQESVEENAQVESAGTLRTVASRAGQAIKTVLLQSFGWFDFSGAISPENVASGSQIAGTDNHSSLFDGVGVWFNASHEFLRFDQTDFENETSISSAIVGADKFVTDNILLGVAIGRSSTDTINLSTFNLGAAAGTQTSDIATTSTSGTIYGAYILNENIYFDASMGITSDSIRTNGSGNTATAFSQSANTRYAAINAYYIQPYADDLIVTYQAGGTRTLSRFSAFTDELNNAGTVGRSRSNSSNVTLGGQASYLFDPQTIINGGAAADFFLTDREIGLARGAVGGSGLIDQQVDSRFQLRLSAGVDHSLTDNITLSGEAGMLTFREDADGWNAGLNIRYDF